MNIINQIQRWSWGQTFANFVRGMTLSPKKALSNVKTMNSSNLSTPNGELVQLLYFRKHPNLGDLDYLNWKRAGLVKHFPNSKIRYDNKLNFLVGCFAEDFAKTGTKFDGIVSPSSTANDAEPYRLSLNTKQVTDFTKCFHRIGNVKSGQSTTLQALINDSNYITNAMESQITSLLIVDETVHSGMTIDATLHHLRQAGLSPNCKITVVTPAWVEKI